MRNCSCLTEMALNSRAKMFILLYFNNGTHARYIRCQRQSCVPVLWWWLHWSSTIALSAPCSPGGRRDHRRDMNPPSRGEHDTSHHGIWAQLVWGVAVPEKLWVKHDWPFKDLQTKWPKQECIIKQLFQKHSVFSIDKLSLFFLTDLRARAVHHFSALSSYCSQLPTVTTRHMCPST